MFTNLLLMVLINRARESGQHSQKCSPPKSCASHGLLSNDTISQLKARTKWIPVSCVAPKNTFCKRGFWRLRYMRAHQHFCAYSDAWTGRLSLPHTFAKCFPRISSRVISGTSRFTSVHTYRTLQCSRVIVSWLAWTRTRILATAIRVGLARASSNPACSNTLSTFGTRVDHTQTIPTIFYRKQGTRDHVLPTPTSSIASYAAGNSFTSTVPTQYNLNPTPCRPVFRS